MKNINLDFKSLLIGILVTTLLFLTIGASPTPTSTIVKSDCDESAIISRILYCIDGSSIRNGKLVTFCDS